MISSPPPLALITVAAENRKHISVSRLCDHFHEQPFYNIDIFISKMTTSLFLLRKRRRRRQRSCYLEPGRLKCRFFCMRRDGAVISAQLQAGALLVPEVTSIVRSALFSLKIREESTPRSQDFKFITTEHQIFF